MERGRDGRRGGGTGAAPAAAAGAAASRRPRIGGPKEASDEDDRMDDAGESRPWERPKKEKVSSFQVSVSANPRSKRKRLAPQETQVQARSSNCDDAGESTEETEIAASEDDDEPPLPLILRRPGKSRGNVKEDEILMDIPIVPRKARSSMLSSSRFSSALRRQQEAVPADVARQQSPVAPEASLNGVSSPNLVAKMGKKLKPPGMKVRAIKVPKVSEPTTISDQEVEVAEALFVLARSMPSSVGISESKFEQKSETKVETEAGNTAAPHMPALSPSHVDVPSTSGPGPSKVQVLGSKANGYSVLKVQNVIVPAAEAPKRKRPRIVVRQEEGRAATPSRMVAPSPPGLVYSPVQEAEQATASERSHVVVDEGLNDQPESLKGMVPTDSAHSVPQPYSIEDAKISILEHRNKMLEAKNPEEKVQDNQDLQEWKPGCSDSIVSSPANVKVEACTENSLRNEGPAKCEGLSRTQESLHDKEVETAKLKLDLMAPPLKVALDGDAYAMSADKSISPKDASVVLTQYSAEARPVKVDNSFEGAEGLEDADRELKKQETKDENNIITERDDVVNRKEKQELEEHVSGQLRKEEIPCQIQRGLTENERESAGIPDSGPPKAQKADTGMMHRSFGSLPVSSFLPSTAAVSSSTPAPLAGWMGGLPPMAYFGSGAPPWPPGVSLPGSNVDGKTTHPVLQLPPAAVLPRVPRMKRCATHVYVAHHIYFEQQRSRHTLWSAALCRGSPYNVNIPPVSVHDKDKIGGTYTDLARKYSTQQVGPAYGYTVPQSSGQGIMNSTIGTSMSVPSLSAGVGVPFESGAGTASGSGVNVAAHAQYIQAMMQQNGFASFPFPFNGPPGQAAQFFSSFYPGHLVSPLPHLQSLAQQSSSLLPPQKQTQGLHTLPHSSLSQLLPTPSSPQQQQQLQLQLAPQSPSNSQQQNHLETQTQHFGAQSEEDSALGGESHSTAESRLSIRQRGMCGRGPSSLPNLNICPSSLMVTTSIPALPSHEQDVSLVTNLGAKPSSKSQQQSHFPSQHSTSISSSTQQQQFIPQHTLAGSGFQMKGLEPAVSQGYSPMTMTSMNRGSIGPGALGLVPVGSMAAQGPAMLQGVSENARVHAQQQPSFAVHSQQYDQRTTPRASISFSEDVFVSSSNKGRDYLEERKSSVNQGGGAALNPAGGDIEVSSSSVQGPITSNGVGGPMAARSASNTGRTLNLANATGARNSRSASPVGIGQVPHLQNQASKQTMARSKSVSGTNVPPANAPPSAYVERNSLPGNYGKNSGSGVSFPGQMAPCSPGLKQGQGQSGTVKVGQRNAQGSGVSVTSGVCHQAVMNTAIVKGQVQQARNNQHGTSSIGTPPRMPSSVSVPVLPAATLPSSTSVLKASGGSASKTPVNGKGTASMTKSGTVTVKRSPGSGPAISAIISSGQNLSAKGLQQKKQNQLPMSQFSQQQSTIPAQQQQLGTKQQGYHQSSQQVSQYKQSFPAQTQYKPQLFPQQHQQYLQHSPSQLQALPQQVQQPSTHYFQQSPHNSSVQHGHPHQHSRSDQQQYFQQQLQSVSSSSNVTTTNNGFSLSPPNLTLGTGIPGNTVVNSRSDGVDQFQVSGPRGNSAKAASIAANQMASGGVSKNNATLHPSSVAMSGQQVSSPPSGSPHYLQLAPVLAKSIEQKDLSDCINRDDMNSVRRLPPPSQPPVISNATSS